jgi:hypothetical protein
LVARTSYFKGRGDIVIWARKGIKLGWSRTLGIGVFFCGTAPDLKEEEAIPY